MLEVEIKAALTGHTKEQLKKPPRSWGLSKETPCRTSMYILTATTATL